MSTCCHSTYELKQFLSDGYGKAWWTMHEDRAYETLGFSILLPACIFSHGGSFTKPWNEVLSDVHSCTNADSRSAAFDVLLNILCISLLTILVFIVFKKYIYLWCYFCSFNDIMQSTGPFQNTKQCKVKDLFFLLVIQMM